VFFQAEDGIRDWSVTGVQTCALPISLGSKRWEDRTMVTEARAPRESLELMLQVRPQTSGEYVAALESFWGETTKEDVLARVAARSEERRVGKEWRSRWWACD